MGVYYGMNGLWVPVGGQGGTAPIDPNLLAENIKSGVTISGVTGTFTNDGTAKASDIANGVTAYVNGQKITGSILTRAGSSETQSPSSISIPESDPNYFRSSYSFSADTLFRKGAKLNLTTSKSNLGNAVRDDVMYGMTFTSSAGVKATGALIPSVAEYTRMSETDLESATKTIVFSLSIDIYGNDTIGLAIQSSKAFYTVCNMIAGTLGSSTSYVNYMFVDYRPDTGWELTAYRGSSVTSSVAGTVSYDSTAHSLTITLSSSRVKLSAGTWSLHAFIPTTSNKYD